MNKNIVINMRNSIINYKYDKIKYRTDKDYTNENYENDDKKFFLYLSNCIKLQNTNQLNYISTRIIIM